MAGIQVNRAFEMDAWMNRYRAFAEGVVVMVCPVILAIALDKVDLKGEERGGFIIAIIMLVVAAITLIAGIFPFLICRYPGERTGSPHTVIKCLAPLSGACLVALASWIHFIIFHKWTYPVIGALIGLCFLIPITKYCFRNATPSDREKQQYNKLENSLEFAAGITALLFVGMEGLALEGQIKSTNETQHRLTKPLGASFFACILGACLMLLQTTPLLISDDNIISKLEMTKLIDILVTCAISLVMFFITQECMKILALILFAPLFLILLVLAFHLAVDNEPQSNGEKYEPASLELTKVTFTGFLAVSIPSISKDSLNKSTHVFVFLAAAAIVSGLVWRLLTHYHSHIFKKTANVASFCTHLFIVAAAIPFTVMAGNALS